MKRMLVIWNKNNGFIYISMNKILIVTIAIKCVDIFGLTIDDETG